MSVHPQPTKPALAESPVPPRAAKTAGGAALTQGTGREAKRRAAAVLEVLAGARPPAQAAASLGLSLPCYYQLESRALRGLLAGCEPRSKGRTPSAAGELARLRQERQRLERELARQQALVRLTQRAAGPPAAAPLAGTLQGKRRRKPTTRAVPVAARLRKGAETEEPVADGAAS